MDNILSSWEYANLKAAEQEHYLSELFGEIVQDEAELEVLSDEEENMPIEINEVVASDGEAPDDEEMPVNEWQEDEEVAEGGVDYEPEYESASEDEMNVDINLQSEVFVSSDGTEWNSQPNIVCQTARQNIMRERRGPHRSTELFSIEETFKCFMSIEMADIIERYTNKRAQAMYKIYDEKRPSSPMT